MHQKKLRTPSAAPAMLTKRDAIIERAYVAFYNAGFHATCMDTVLADSGISKRTLYKYFRSKEDLIAAVIAHYQEVLFAEIHRRMAIHHADPKKQILSLFEMKSEALARGDFVGCFAVNAKLEFEGKHHQIEAACHGLYARLEAQMTALCKQAHCAQPRATARAIMMVFSGALMLAQIHREARMLTDAKAVARGILDQAVASAARTKKPKHIPAARGRRCG